MQSERHPLFEMDGKAVDKIHSLFYSVSRPNQGNCLFARLFTSLYLSLLLYNFLKYVSMYFSIGIVPQLSKKILKQFIWEIRFIILINLPLLTLTPKYIKIRYEGILLPPYPEKLLPFPRPVQTYLLRLQQMPIKNIPAHQTAGLPYPFQKHISWSFLDLPVKIMRMPIGVTHINLDY